MRFRYAQLLASTFGQAEMSGVFGELLAIRNPTHSALKPAAARRWSRPISVSLTGCCWTRCGHTRCLEIRLSEERVHLHGDSAALNGVADMRASIDGTEWQLRNRYTNGWAKSDEGWWMIVWQSTAVPKAWLTIVRAE